MRIWVDADACPNVIKEILFRAAIRTKTETIFVANQLIRIPPSPFLKNQLVSQGFDVADNEIVKKLAEGDLVITADIPLADATIDKLAYALNPRGEVYTKDNIKQRLSIRNFNEAVRSSGVVTGGPATLHKRDLQAFANALDRFLVNKKF
jgi:uncharacterized protein YaiI (UPF0178 family)